MDADKESLFKRTIARERKAREVAEALVEERTEALRVAYENLKNQEELRFVTALDLMPSPVLLINSVGIVLSANESAARIYDAVSKEKLEGLPVGSILLDFEQIYSESPNKFFSCLMMQESGIIIPVEVTCGEVDFRRQNCQIVSIRDLSEIQRHQQALRHQATHDALTGLPNRMLLLDRLQQAISSAPRRKAKLAVYFIDLDKFKFINDSMGHEAGDHVLREMADRFLQCVRDGDTVARIGGDEFVVLCEIQDIHQGDIVANRILDSLLRSVAINGQMHSLGGSVGISYFPRDGEDPEALLKHADMAMYHSKSAGGNQVHAFTMAMQQEVEEHIQLESHLRQAIPNGELILYYQPQVDLHTGTLTGFEALLRWNSPKYGMVPPGKFIPIAEESNLIKTLGHWVLHAACRQINRWHDTGHGWLTVAVNLSAAEFCSGETVGNIEQALKEHAIPPECLELELTESMSLSDPQSSIETMRQIKKLGVRLAIDDFGVGYSNLGYLRKFPADCLKIDQSFTRGICKNAGDRSIVSTVIQLARSLSMVSLAEGAETLEDAQQLYALGADRVQGYWVAKPAPPEKIEEMLTKERMFDPAEIMLSGQRGKVLVVDDHESIRMLLEISLEEHLNLQVICASNGPEAEEALLKNSFVAVISDYYMEGETGVDVLAKAKRLAPESTRILITGSSDPQVLREAINIAGVSHFLNKPIDLYELFEILKVSCRNALTQT